MVLCRVERRLQDAFVAKGTIYTQITAIFLTSARPNILPIAIVVSCSKSPSEGNFDIMLLKGRSPEYLTKEEMVRISGRE